ncbi:unnamed protein product [Heligmosomoides polygyrus]|uniref:EF-hand domain-containing protein n=1 Tax=Heligmosomoides polygyrus TaxID=6339 RepID=A0A3P8DI51_HELPZ|nr:unnamed protein product [Heligmosomoides polygyrus]
MKDMPVGDMNLEDLIDMFPNIEPFLIRKWHYAFYTFFDLTGNNVIEWRDFQTLIDAIGAVRGEDGEEHTAARHSLTDVWHSMTETMKKDVNDKVIVEIVWHVIQSSVRNIFEALTVYSKDTWKKDCLHIMRE